MDGTSMGGVRGLWDHPGLPVGSNLETSGFAQIFGIGSGAGTAASGPGSSYCCGPAWPTPGAASCTPAAPSSGGGRGQAGSRGKSGWKDAQATRGPGPGPCNPRDSQEFKGIHS